MVKHCIARFHHVTLIEWHVECPVEVFEHSIRCDEGEQHLVEEVLVPKELRRLAPSLRNHGPQTMDGCRNLAGGCQGLFLEKDVVRRASRCDLWSP